MDWERVASALGARLVEGPAGVTRYEWDDTGAVEVAREGDALVYYYMVWPARRTGRYRAWSVAALRPALDSGVTRYEIPMRSHVSREMLVVLERTGLAEIRGDVLHGSILPGSRYYAWVKSSQGS